MVVSYDDADHPRSGRKSFVTRKPIQTMNHIKWEPCLKAKVIRSKFYCETVFGQHL